MPPSLHKPTADGAYRRTVHAADTRRAEVIEGLAQIVRRADLFDHNEEEMALSHAVAIRLTVHHPGGGSARFLVYTHHFGAEGMWFIHSGYLHPGTRCVLALPRGDDQEGGALGAIETCEHLDRNLHAVSMRFDGIIDPDIFRGVARQDAGLAANFTDSLPLPTRHSRVLLLDTDDHDREHSAFQLRSMGARVSCYERLADAVGDIQSEGFDLVLAEFDTLGGADDRRLETIREVGHAGPVVVLTREPDPQRLRSIRRAGAFAVLRKPCDPALLLRTLAAALQPAAPTLPPMRDAGSAAPSPRTIEAIASVAAALEQSCRDLLDAARADDPERVRAFLASPDSKPSFAPTTTPDSTPRADESLRGAMSTLQDLIRLIGTPASPPGAPDRLPDR